MKYEIKTAFVKKKGVAPKNFYLTKAYPTYYYINDNWVLPTTNFKNGVPVIKNNIITIKDIIDLEIGEEVILSSKGIKKDKDALTKNRHTVVAESSFSQTYDRLFSDLKKKNHNAIWVLGPSVVFDEGSKKALVRLIEGGFVNALLAGNALATHDLEGEIYKTALGQRIDNQKIMPQGHTHHLNVLNDVRACGSMEEYIKKNNLNEAVMAKIIKNKIPYVLCGSVRDDGPLPEVYGSTKEGIRKMKEVISSGTVIICVATMLHSNSVADIAPTFRKEDDKILPLNMYVVDITTNVINNIIASRSRTSTIGIVTNAQDFIKTCANELCGEVCDE